MKTCDLKNCNYCAHVGENMRNVGGMTCNEFALINLLIMKLNQMQGLARLIPEVLNQTMITTAMVREQAMKTKERLRKAAGRASRISVGATTMAAQSIREVKCSKRHIPHIQIHILIQLQNNDSIFFTLAFLHYPLHAECE